MPVNPCGMIVEPLRNGYIKPMRFWQGDPTTVNVRWYLADPGARALPYETQFGSTNWDEDTWIRPLGETKGPSRVYEKGQNETGYPGVRSCGDASAWLCGGVHGVTPELVAGPNGTSACCGTAARSALFGVGTGLTPLVWVSKYTPTGTGLVSPQTVLFPRLGLVASGTGLITDMDGIFNQLSRIASGTGLISETAIQIRQPSLIGTGTGGISEQFRTLGQGSSVGSGTGLASAQRRLFGQGSLIGSGTGLGSLQGIEMPYLGEYKLMFGITPPAGWLLCDGSGFNIGAHPALAALIGDTFASHSGSTYYVPNLGSLVAVGGGQSGPFTARVPGNSGGEETVILTGPQSGMPLHHHGQNTANLPTGGSIGYSGITAFTGQGNFATGQNTADAGPLSAVAGHENMQPWLCAGYWFIFAGP